MLSDTIKILERLVAFPSVSGMPTHGIVDYIKAFIEGHGIQVNLSFDSSGERANIFATLGPKVNGGIVLNGHTDVVPVEGQKWDSDPFTLTKSDNCLYGRGAVDMKGFLACVMASIPTFKAMNLKKPIHIAFTFDEETGGHGMPFLLNSREFLGCSPEIVIVGEPTEMNIITGHKGVDEMRTEITGFEVHSCNPNRGVNAISVAMKLIKKIEEVGDRLASLPCSHATFEPPYATFNIGRIQGGTARNATAGWCNFDWEFRSMPGEDNRAIIAEIEEYVEKVLLPPIKAINENAEIKVITEVSAPPFGDINSEKAARFVSELTGKNSRSVVSFGTDAGYFSAAGFSTVVCGPGSISRAHAPGEYITIGELKEGLSFMKKIANHLA